MYKFLSKHLGLNLKIATDNHGLINEHFVTLLERRSLEVWPGKDFPKGITKNCAAVIAGMDATGK